MDVTSESPKPASALWKTITRLEKNKINTWIAFRNALGVAIPLSVGIAIGKPLGGVAFATGALNVSYSDGKDPYAYRARRMLAWTVLGAVAVFIGSVTGRYHVPAILIAGAWAFVAGLLTSVSTRAGDLGLNTLVALLVFAARGAMDWRGASITALLVLGGGLLQALFALLFWAVDAHDPERQSLGQVYTQLAQDIHPETATLPNPEFQPKSTQISDTREAVGLDHSLEGERYRMLFDQAARIQMSAYVLHRLRSELGHEERRQHAASDPLAAKVTEVLCISSAVLKNVGQCLAANNCAASDPVLKAEWSRVKAEIETLCEQQDAPLAKEITSAMEVIAGQLRLVMSLADHSVSAGAGEFQREEETKPWRLRVNSWVGTMRANVDPRSAYFRHAVRLSACVMMGDTIGRMISWQRSYWIPMTIAVILKPDFATTFTRGALRLSGTLAGLVIATGLYHVLPQSAIVELLLVGGFTFMLRSIGPANYGVFTTAVSGLVVFLIAETGISPRDVVLQRAINTTAGGLFALAAYAVWPTWDRKQAPELFADMLDACRSYFHAVAERFGERQIAYTDLDEFRSAWRRSRSNVEASVDRIAAEPGARLDDVKLWTSMLASSHSLMHSMMGLEALLTQGKTQTPPDAFRTFTSHVELTLYYLSAALKGSPAALGTLPQLREDHTRLAKSRNSFSPEDTMMVIDTDRLTVSLNTLREQVTRYAQPNAEAVSTLARTAPA